MNSVPIGLGISLPQKCIKNNELPKELNTSDEWIVQRTGISQRYIASEGETTASLATQAALKALEHAKISPQEIDLIVLGTVTGDYTFPSTATIVQKNLGITQGAAFDIAAACSGFVYALDVADSYIKLGKTKCALVIGSETFSKIVNWSDRSSCVLFGDGAGAMVLQAQENTDRGIKYSNICSDGGYLNHLITTGGVSTTQNAGFIKMNGQEVFKFAVEKFNESLNKLLKDNNMTIDDVDLLVPHQANSRIIHKLIAISGIEEKKVLINIDKYANTSAASIPLALNEVKDAFFSMGNIVLLSMGAGFTWGSVLIRL
ncbi:MAG: ketoacyl-ACP synthase III [Holosporaceae bacterium]|jgi:3-oxoacyl-[acyl-carrier-protein] synthase-3|nr:ketoacyl-ACP synthase III [Holosporaceae bacterium]